MHSFSELTAAILQNGSNIQSHRGTVQSLFLDKRRNDWRCKASAKP